MRRCNAIESVMNQPVIFGGEIATRYEVIEFYEQLEGKNGERLSFLAAERLAYMYPEATEEDIERLPRALFELGDK